MFENVWGSDKPKTVEETIADRVNKSMENADLFGVADLMCQQSAEMMRKIQPHLKYTTALEIKPGGDFDMRIGGYHNSRSVTIGPDICRGWPKK